MLYQRFGHFRYLINNIWREAVNMDYMFIKEAVKMGKTLFLG